MPLVEVKGVRVRVPQVAEHPQPADAEDDFLADPRELVASVEAPAELSILRTVAVEVRVQKVDGNGIARLPDDFVHPASHADVVPLDRHGDFVRELAQFLLGMPGHRLFRLPVFRVERLLEVSLPIQQRDADRRNAEIRRALQDVSGKESQSAGIGRDRLLDADLHGEVRNGPERRIEFNNAAHVASGACPSVNLDHRLCPSHSLLSRYYPTFRRGGSIPFRRRTSCSGAQSPVRRRDPHFRSATASFPKRWTACSFWRPPRVRECPAWEGCIPTRRTP